MRTGLLLVLRAARLPLMLPRLGESEALVMANGYKLMLAARSKNPTKMRKGKSGEIPR